MIKETTINFTVKEMLYEIKKDINEVKQDVKTHLEEENKDIKALTKQVMLTNGKVKNVKWIATTALMICLLIIGWIVQNKI